MATQDEFHRPYYGVVPEIASRKHLESIEPVVDEGAGGGGVGLEAVDGIAATYRPGLVGSLLVGLSFAKGLAWPSTSPSSASTTSWRTCTPPTWSARSPTPTSG